MGQLPRKKGDNRIEKTSALRSETKSRVETQKMGEETRSVGGGTVSPHLRRVRHQGRSPGKTQGELWLQHSIGGEKKGDKYTSGQRNALYQFGIGGGATFRRGGSQLGCHRTNLSLVKGLAGKRWNRLGKKDLPQGRPGRKRTTGVSSGDRQWANFFVAASCQGDGGHGKKKKSDSNKVRVESPETGTGRTVVRIWGRKGSNRRGGRTGNRRMWSKGEKRGGENDGKRFKKKKATKRKTRKILDEFLGKFSSGGRELRVAGKKRENSKVNVGPKEKKKITLNRKHQ